jgi:two-component system chemotaxis response regulator CheY
MPFRQIGGIVMAKILIVDDSMTSKKFLRTMLERAGCEIIGEASDGQEGVDKYKELKPDVVTMDITMPIKNGIEALEEIIAYDSNAKVVMVTAAGQNTNIVEALKLGAADFIQKPFEVERIAAVIKKVLEK